MACGLGICTYGRSCQLLNAQELSSGGASEVPLQKGLSPEKNGRGLEEDPLELLSRNQYSRRQQATLEMWSQREESREQVQEAARHPDPEVSGRAKWILRQWRRGSLPNTPQELSRLLLRTDGPAAIERLLEVGQFDAAVVAIEESAGTVDHEAIQKRVSLALRRRFPVYVHEAMSRDLLAELVKLVDLVAETKEMAVCRIQLMQQLGIDISDDALLPKSARNWSMIQRDRASTLVLLTLGKVDQAIELARESSDADLLHQCRMIASHWSEAAADSVVAARQAERGSYEHARLWSLTLIAADRAANEKLSQEAIDELSSVDANEDDLASELRWKCLASHGQVEAAFKILDQVNPGVSATVSIDASRASRAFRVLGYPLERVDQDLHLWIADAIEAQRTEKNERLSPKVREIFALMQCLLAVGRDDAAWVIAKRLSQSELVVFDKRLREFVLSTLIMTRRSDWIVALSVLEGERQLSDDSRRMVAMTLPESDRITFEIMVKAMAEVLPDRSLREHVEAASELMRGELPRGFQRDRDFRLLFQYVTASRTMKQLRGQFVIEQEILANLNIAKVFARHGEVGYATSCLRKLATNGDVRSMFQLAEQELDGGRLAEAEKLFHAVIDTVAKQGRSNERSVSSDDVGLAVKALVGTWVVARRSGDHQLADSLQREIKLVLCTPSTRLRYTIAEYLGERGESMLALEAYEVLLPMTVFDSEEKTRLYDVARSYSLLARNTNVSEAARWFDLAVGGTLDSMDFRPGAYITLPLYVGRWSLEAAIESKDREEVKRQLDRILKLDPMDIDFAERLLPEMRKVGMADLADETINRVMDRGLEYAKKFPFDAMTCNNLAWVAAMNEKRLNDALLLAENAVYVEPESAIYRDTLAEVLFLLGRKSEALDVERGCLLDDPGQWHLHEQIEKYESALAEEPS